MFAVFVTNSLFVFLCSKETAQAQEQYRERVEKAIEYALTIES